MIYAKITAALSIATVLILPSPYSFVLAVVIASLFGWWPGTALAHA